MGRSTNKPAVGGIRLRPPEIEIPQENPFCNDKFGRKENANVLTEFVSSLSHPAVVCLDAPWGYGKTTFIKMWAKKLENENILYKIINAWESDYNDDPFTVIFGEFNELIDQASGDTKDLNQIIEKSRKLGSSVLKRLIPITAKAATLGALDIDKEAEKIFSEMSETIAKGLVDEYNSQKKSIEEFKEIISDLVSKIVEGKAKNIVIIVDELDRCRPTYAVEFLERIKHFFNINGLVFVLSLDKQQLSSHLRSVYGDGLDVENYIRRFIDIDYKLPKPSNECFDNYYMKLREEMIYSNFKGVKNQQRRVSEFESTFMPLAKIFDLRPRVIEKMLSKFSIMCNIYDPDTAAIHPYVTGVLLAVMGVNEKLVLDFLEHKVEYFKVTGFIEEYKGGKEFLGLEESRNTGLIELFELAHDGPREVTEKINAINDTDGAQRKDRIKKNIYGSLLVQKEFGWAALMKERIEMSGQFR